jgi:hypothetical protein
MYLSLPLAAFDPTMIIWLIIGFFWVVANVVKAAKQNEQKAKRKRDQQRHQGHGQHQKTQQQQPRPPEVVNRPKPKRSAFDDPVAELRAFIESLEGTQSPPPPPAPEPEPEVVNWEIPATAPEPPPIPTTGEEVTFRPYAEIEDIQDIQSLEEYDFEEKNRQHHSLQSNNLLVDLSGMKIPMITIPTQSITTTHRRTRVSRPAMRHMNDVRNVLVGRLILGPPKALQQPGHEEL